MLARFMFILSWFVSTAMVCSSPLHALDGGSSPLQSPRLAALQDAAEQKHGEALDAFWREIDARGAPLVEEVPGEPDQALFTFLWRADPEEDAVNVRLGASFPTRTPNDAFTRLGATNVWYTSYLMPRAARLIYRIRAPQGLRKSPLARDRFTIDGIRYELFPDPLNHRTFPAASDPLVAQSEVLGPAAKDSPYLYASVDVPRGSLYDELVESAVLKGPRKVTVYTPPGYSDQSPHLPLLLVFDAEAYIEQVSAPTLLDNMIAAKKIPPLIAVFVHSKGTRDSDLPPNERFPSFIVDELLPRLRHEYRLAEDPQKNVVCGSSFGGLAATHLAYRHPEAFGKVISQSGSFWWFPGYTEQPSPSPDAGAIIKQLAEAGPKPVRLHMEVGQWESPGMVSANRMLASVLRGKGYDIRYNEFLGGHHYAYWRQTLPDALIAMLGE